MVTKGLNLCTKLFTFFQVQEDDDFDESDISDWEYEENELNEEEDYNNEDDHVLQHECCKYSQKIRCLVRK